LLNKFARNKARMKLKFSSIVPLVFAMVLVNIVIDNSPPALDSTGGRSAKPTITIGQTPHRSDAGTVSKNTLIMPQTTQPQSARLSHKG
jgi:hypothetical protein